MKRVPEGVYWPQGVIFAKDVLGGALQPCNPVLGGALMSFVPEKVSNSLFEVCRGVAQGTHILCPRKGSEAERLVPEKGAGRIDWPEEEEERGPKTLGIWPGHSAWGAHVLAKVWALVGEGGHGASEGIMAQHQSAGGIGSRPRLEDFQGPADWKGCAVSTMVTKASMSSSVILAEEISCKWWRRAGQHAL